MPTTGDSNTSSYPYFTRVSRELKKTETVLIKNLIKKPIAYNNCCCPNNSRISNKELPTENDIKNMCDEIFCFYNTPQQSIINDCVLIINFEGVIGYIAESKLKLRRGALNFLIKACKIFKIIIVASSQKIVSTILSTMEMKSIRISGIYYRQNEHNKEVVYLQNIYKDFNIKNPNKSVLVISSFNAELSKNEPIFPLTQRINKHLNITICPVSTEHSPIIFLVPHMLINIKIKPFRQL